MQSVVQRTLHYLVVALVPVFGSAQTHQKLEGCVAPKTIAVILANLQPTNTHSLSVDEVRSLWPYEMSETETSTTNRTLESEDRILKGVPQCSTSFLFGRDEHDGDLHRLYSVIVNYSAVHRRDLDAMATVFEKAVGVGKTKFVKVVTSSTEDYDWQTTNGKKLRLYAIEMRFTRQSNLWKMHFRAAFYDVEP